VLIALGAEQLREAVHRQTQALELSHKFHNQSADNRHVVIYDINTLVDGMNGLESDIAALGPDGDPRALKQFVRADLFAMSDSTWVAPRNSDLIDLLPSRDVGNYEKLSITSDFGTSKCIHLAQRQKLTDSNGGQVAIGALWKPVPKRREVNLR